MCPGPKLLLTLAAGLFVCAYARAQTAETGEQAFQAEPAPIRFQVLKQRSFNLGDRALIINRVVPPILPALPPEPPPPPPPTAEEIAVAKAAWERSGPHKKYEMLFLSTTVYDRKVTELRWFQNQRECRVFSNIDFNFLCGAGEFETEDTVYMLMMGIGNETSEQVEGFNQYARENGWPKRSQKQIPALETFSKTRSEYVVVEDEAHAAPPEEDLAALDALHIYFDANKQRLVEEYTNREAARIAQEQWLKEHPPVPKDIVFNYWRKPSPPAKAPNQ